MGLNHVDAATKLRLHGCDVFRAWLGGMLVNNPNGMGHELVTSLAGIDQPARADVLLAAAETLGWIERTAFAPSDEQLFFGVGGMPGSHLVSKAGESTREFHAQLHMFRVVDREAVEGYVGDKRPDRTSFQLLDKVRYAAAFIRQCQEPSMKRSRGVVVGFANEGRWPRVAWNDQPDDEPECDSPYFEGTCLTRRRGVCLEHRRIPYVARAISPTAISKR